MTDEPIDVDDPAAQALRRWGGAIRDWQVGNAMPLHDMIRAANLNVPEFVVDFLADLVEGSVDRPQGRPPERTFMEEIALVSEVMNAWDSAEIAPSSRDNSGPQDVALTVVAERHGVPTGTVRGVLNKLRGQGLTRADWKRYKAHFQALKE